MLDDDRTRPTAEAGIEHVRRLSTSVDAIGSRMAGRSVEAVGDPEVVRLATSVLAEDPLGMLSA